MHVTVEPADLPLARPFRVASFTIEAAKTVVARLEYEGLVGIGEAAPLERYGDTVAGIIAAYSTYAIPAGSTPFAFDAMLAPLPRAARCALDVALHDLAGKLLGVPVRDLLGLAGLPVPPTSMTVGIDEPAVMLENVRALRDLPAIKVKVGTGDDVALIEAIRASYAGAIRLDANEGWTPERAVEILTAIAPFDIELCEQPIRAGQPAALRWISERVTIPIVADEDALEAADLPALMGTVAGVNVKLAKCGGIRAATRMIAMARAMGFRVMLGCMAETSILATAAAHIAPLVDWLDIDGPLMLARDPYRGLTYAEGRVSIPSLPGLGVISAHEESSD